MNQKLRDKLICEVDVGAVGGKRTYVYAIIDKEKDSVRVHEISIVDEKASDVRRAFAGELLMLMPKDVFLRIEKSAGVKGEI